MHVHLSRPSAASAAALLTTIGVLALIGCAEWDMQTRAEAASRFAAAGDFARAIVTMLPFPWAMPVAGVVAVGGHILTAVLRRGQRPQPTANARLAEERPLRPRRQPATGPE